MIPRYRDNSTHSITVRARDPQADARRRLEAEAQLRRLWGEGQEPVHPGWGGHMYDDYGFDSWWDSIGQYDYPNHKRWDIDPDTKKPYPSGGYELDMADVPGAEVLDLFRYTPDPLPDFNEDLPLNPRADYDLLEGLAGGAWNPLYIPDEGEPTFRTTTTGRAPVETIPAEIPDTLNIPPVPPVPIPEPEPPLAPAPNPRPREPERTPISINSIGTGGSVNMSNFGNSSSVSNPTLDNIGNPTIRIGPRGNADEQGGLWSVLLRNLA